MTLRHTWAEAQRIEGRSLLSRVHNLRRTTNSSRRAITPTMFRIAMCGRGSAFVGPRPDSTSDVGRIDAYPYSGDIIGKWKAPHSSLNSDLEAFSQQPFRYNFLIFEL